MSNVVPDPGPDVCWSIDGTVAPTIADALFDPSPDTTASAVQALGPRGALWRTDEAASPAEPGIMGGVWSAIGSVFGDLYRAAAETAAQVYLSAIEFSIGDWEAELGLPDPCLFQPASFEGRKRAVQIKYRDRGGASPWYFLCLLSQVGVEATIEEPSNFECGVSECGGCDETSNIVLDVYWIITIQGLDAFYFHAGESVAGDRLSDWNAALDAECLIRARAPMHTIPVFRYV